MSGPLLSVQNLEVGYTGRPLTKPLTFSVGAGQMWALIGRNGSGKTTLLRTLLGLMPPRGGRVERAHGLRVAYVPQRITIDESVPARVRDLVESGHDTRWSFLRPGRAARRAAADRALQTCGASELADCRFRDLSEGQKQRVLVARALASAPQLLVLDEPASAMDQHAEHALFALLDDLCRDGSLGIVLVSHHVDFTLHHATHVALIDRDPTCVATGTVAHVAASTAFRTRYGVPPRDIYCEDETHDHAGHEHAGLEHSGHEHAGHDHV